MAETEMHKAFRHQARDSLNIFGAMPAFVALLHVLLLLPVTSALHTLRLTRKTNVPSNCVMKITADDAKSACAALENGDATAESLFETCLAKRADANIFFREYLDGPEWSCADASTPPTALTTALLAAPEATLEVSSSFLFTSHLLSR